MKQNLLCMYQQVDVRVLNSNFLRNYEGTSVKVEETIIKKAGIYVWARYCEAESDSKIVELKI